MGIDLQIVTRFSKPTKYRTAFTETGYSFFEPSLPRALQLHLEELEGLRRNVG